MSEHVPDLSGVRIGTPVRDSSGQEFATVLAVVDGGVRISTGRFLGLDRGIFIPHELIAYYVADADYILLRITEDEVYRHVRFGQGHSAQE